jgi:HlyD family secretion protein
MVRQQCKMACMNRYIIWLTVAAVAIAAAILVWFNLRGPLVAGVEIRAAPLVRTLRFSARVATLSRVDVGSTITGRVAKVLVKEGADAHQGDVLVELESDELRAALVQAQASLSQAQARLEGLRSTGRASAKAVLMQADATLRAAQAELSRSQQLVVKGFVSASRVDDAQRAVDVARAQQVSAQSQAQANGEAGTDIAQAQAQVQQARAAVDSGQSRMAQAHVLAPANAQVLSRQVEPGQIVQPGRALLSLALAGPTQIVALVDERFLAQLQIGQAAAVVADAFAGQRLAARVLSIAPGIDAQRGAVEVKLSLDAPPPAFLREDMTLSVEVETGRRASALVLPLAAIRGNTANTAASSRVLVALDGRAQLREVRLGLRTLDAAEVLQGLSAGDVVLLGSETNVDQKMRVKVQAWQPNSVTVANGQNQQDAGQALSNAMGR